MRQPPETPDVESPQATVVPTAAATAKPKKKTKKNNNKIRQMIYRIRKQIRVLQLHTKTASRQFIAMMSM